MTAQARPETTKDRTYDVVIFGATGFTGKLVAEYLAEHRPRGLRWAIAGRSHEKLERVRADLLALDPTLDKLPILIGDSDDKASLDAIAKQTRVVCTTAGPYAKYGKKLVAACAENGTDYCDLTGEPTFIRDTIDSCEAAAKASGARIVPSCGFDSLPSDLGVHLLYEYFAEKGLTLAEAKLYVVAMKGGPSGGTLATMMNIFDEAKRDPAVRKLLGDPYALNPDRSRDRGPDGRDQMGVVWDSEEQCWTGPFVMASINTRVVRRSNALRGFAYGRDFRYAEVMKFPKGPAGLLKAAALTAGMAGMALATASALRPLAQRVMPAPGEGPSKSERENGFFKVLVVGKSHPDKTGRSERAVARIDGRRDPGYGETARMLGEAALCLAKDPLERHGGILTPAVAMGTTLVERLRKIGMRWEVTPA